MLQLLELPTQSVAVHVRVTLYSCGHAPGVVTSSYVIVGESSQASTAVASPKTGVFGHSTGDTTVGQVITGAVVSTTSIVLLQLLELPTQSVAVHVRVTLYSCGHAPGVVISSYVIVGESSQASTAVASPKTGVFGHSTGDTTVGQVITGAVVSTTSIVLLQLLELPTQSVAVHVRVTLYSCGHVPGVVTSSYVIVGESSQASTAVASPKTGVFGHSTGDTTVGQVITGAVVSTTSIVLLQLLELPTQSVAVHVRVTLYSCGHVPGVVTSSYVIVGESSQASTAVASPKTGVFGHSTGETTVGHVITGAVVSTTSIVLLQLLELPTQSVAVHVRVTLYSCGHVPGVVTSSYVIVGESSQASTAVASPKTGVFGHSTGETTVGQVITGAVVSTTSIVLLHEALLPQASVAVQVRVTLYSCGHDPGVVTSANVTVGALSQSSVAVASPKTGVFGHSIGDTTVGQLSTGGVTSAFTVKVAPQESIRSQ